MLKAQVAGNIGRDPEQKTFDSGKSVTTFSVASNRKVKGEKITDWVKIEIWNEKKQEFVLNYLKKGQGVYIDGPANIETWEKDGKTNAQLVIKPDFEGSIAFLGSAGDDAPRNNNSEDRNNPEDDDLDDAIPW